MSNEKYTLLPCPFCSGRCEMTSGIATEAVWPHGEFNRVFCASCQTRQLFHKTPEDAADAWNRREHSCVVPDGYVLAPCEPTPEMVAACISAWQERLRQKAENGTLLCGGDPEKSHRENWAAMLAAAPSAPAENAGVPDGWHARRDEDAHVWFVQSPTGDVAGVLDQAAGVHAEVLRQLAQDLAAAPSAPESNT